MKPDLISREEAKAAFTRAIYTHLDIDEILDAVPAADPVVHGEWLKAETNWDTYYMCSVCDGDFANNAVNYCPYCGAKMDGCNPEEEEHG